MSDHPNPATVLPSAAAPEADGHRGFHPHGVLYPMASPSLSPAAASVFSAVGDQAARSRSDAAPVATRAPRLSSTSLSFRVDDDGKAQLMARSPSTAPAPWTVGRSAQMLRHLSHHEAAHALVARAFGVSVAGLTIVPSPTNEGLCWFTDGVEPPANLEQDNAQMLDFVGECVSLILTKPRIGEKRKRDEAKHAYHVQQRCIELLAGKVAELIMMPEEEPFGAQHDHAVASAMATTVVSSGAVEAYLAFCAKEAETIIRANVDVLEAIAGALLERGTLTGRQLDEIIRVALAHRALHEDQERRAAMRRVAESAAASSALFERVR